MQSIIHSDNTLYIYAMVLPSQHNGDPFFGLRTLLQTDDAVDMALVFRHAASGFMRRFLCHRSVVAATSDYIRCLLEYMDSNNKLFDVGASTDSGTMTPTLTVDLPDARMACDECVDHVICVIYGVLYVQIEDAATNRVVNATGCTSYCADRGNVVGDELAAAMHECVDFLMCDPAAKLIEKFKDHHYVVRTSYDAHGRCVITGGGNSAFTLSVHAPTAGARLAGVWTLEPHMFWPRHLDKLYSVIAKGWFTIADSKRA